MSRLIIAIGLMGVASLVSFLAGFMFCAWGYEERYRNENRWN